MKTPISAEIKQWHKFPGTYPLDRVMVYETRKGYRVTLTGRQHPNRLALPESESLWVPKSRVTFECVEHAANWAAHSVAAKRLRIRWDGLCLITQWRAAGLPESVCSEVAAEMRELYGVGCAHTNPMAQNYMRAVLRHECAKFNRPVPPPILEGAGVN